MHVLMYTYTYTYVYIHIYMDIYVYIHMYMEIHIYTPSGTSAAGTPPRCCRPRSRPVLRERGGEGEGKREREARGRHHVTSHFPTTCPYTGLYRGV